VKYLFYISKYYSIAIIQPLMRLMDREERDYALLVNQSVWERLPQTMRSQRVFTSLSQAKEYQPDYVLVPGNFVDHRIPGMKVQIFHGLGVEKDAHFRIRHFFDAYFTSGPYVTQRFLAMQQKHPYFEVRETGWLKIDGILSWQGDDPRQTLQIPSGKRVILYAPTFSRSMESARELAAVIPRIIKEDEYWLFKFHLLMPQELIAPFQDIDPAKGRIHTQEDITICLHASDVLISDTSSVVYEFYALDKPVITYKSIARPHKALDIRDASQLRAAINRCLDDPEELKLIRNEAMAEVNPYLDGSIAKRTLAALDSLSPKEFPRPGKPLNLFRKLKTILQRHN